MTRWFGPNQPLADKGWNSHRNSTQKWQRSSMLHAGDQGSSIQKWWKWLKYVGRCWNVYGEATIYFGLLLVSPSAPWGATWGNHLRQFCPTNPKPETMELVNLPRFGFARVFVQKHGPWAETCGTRLQKFHGFLAISSDLAKGGTAIARLCSWKREQCDIVSKVLDEQNPEKSAPAEISLSNISVQYGTFM